jgi:hypothetical protein
MHRCDPAVEQSGRVVARTDYTLPRSAALSGILALTRRTAKQRRDFVQRAAISWHMHCSSRLCHHACAAASVQPKEIIMTRIHWLLAVPVFCAACAGSQTNQMTEKQMARIEKQQDKKIETVDKQADKRQAMVDKNFAAHKDVISDSDRPDADRSAKMLDEAKDRSDYHVQTRAELDKLAVRIKAAQDKVKVLGPMAPDPVRQELSKISTEQSTLQEQFAEMNEAAPSSWEEAKSTMEGRISNLETRLSDVSSAIDDAS